MPVNNYATDTALAAPLTPRSSAVVAGRANVMSGKMLAGVLTQGIAVISITNYDNTYPGASGETLVVSCSCEVQ